MLQRDHHVRGLVNTQVLETKAQLAEVSLQQVSLARDDAIQALLAEGVRKKTTRLVSLGVRISLRRTALTAAPSVQKY